MSLERVPRSCFLSFFACTLTAAIAADYRPPGSPTKEENQAIFKQYCYGTANSLRATRPKYKNESVAEAARNLGSVPYEVFLFYKEVREAYPYKESTAKKNKPDWVRSRADEFLTNLCFLYRDRASMIEAKVKWLNNFFVPTSASQQAIDYSQNIWSQLSAHAYRRYVEFSEAYFDAKEKEMEEESDYYYFGDYEVYPAVAPHSVCENKFIIGEYVAKGYVFSGLDEFRESYPAFKKKHCPVDPETGLSDDDYVNDFRGDSNFKPRSPESNGMLWYGHKYMRACETHKKVKPEHADSISNAACEDYFRKPFESRWNGARAGLGAWFLHEEAAEQVFYNEFPDEDKKETLVSKPFYVWAATPPALHPFGYAYSHSKKDKESLETVWFEFIHGSWEETVAAWVLPDFGVNELWGLGSDDREVDKETVYIRVRNIVERHTGWGSAGFDDGASMKRSRAYSPLAATSYDIARSDEFAQPGLTIAAGNQLVKRKRWMFVFKILKSDLYTTDSLEAGEPIDVDRDWFDELSFGETYRAKYERAFDRLGTPLEYELDSILFLENVSAPISFSFPEDPRKIKRKLVSKKIARYPIYDGRQAIDPLGRLVNENQEFVNPSGNKVEQAVHIDNIYEALLKDLPTPPETDENGYLINPATKEHLMRVVLYGRSFEELESPIDALIHISEYWHSYFDGTLEDLFENVVGM